VLAGGRARASSATASSGSRRATSSRPTAGVRGHPPGRQVRRPRHHSEGVRQGGSSWLKLQLPPHQLDLAGDGAGLGALASIPGVRPRPGEWMLRAAPRPRHGARAGRRATRIRSGRTRARPPDLNRLFPTWWRSPAPYAEPARNVDYRMMRRSSSTPTGRRRALSKRYMLTAPALPRRDVCQARRRLALAVLGRSSVPLGGIGAGSSSVATPPPEPGPQARSAWQRERTGPAEERALPCAGEAWRWSSTTSTSSCADKRRRWPICRSAHLNGEREAIARSKRRSHLSSPTEATSCPASLSRR
jgi:hypothetical protein